MWIRPIDTLIPFIDKHNIPFRLFPRYIGSDQINSDYGWLFISNGKECWDIDVDTEERTATVQKVNDMTLFQKLI